MPFWKKHKLPKFPPGVKSQFLAFCEALSPDAIKQYQAELDQEYSRIQETAKTNRLVDTHRAKEIVDRCKLLLERYGEFNDEQRGMIVGAIRYFTFAEDPFPEEAFASGFNDDAKVLNYVLEELGIEDRFIEI